MGEGADPEEHEALRVVGQWCQRGGYLGSYSRVSAPGGSSSRSTPQPPHAARRQGFTYVLLLGLDEFHGLAPKGGIDLQVAAERLNVVAERREVQSPARSILETWDWETLRACAISRRVTPA